MSRGWINFDVITGHVSMEMVLGHYGIDWLRKGRDGVYGRCPLHLGRGTRPFHASFTKNLYQCFSCGSKGSIIQFVAAMEKCSNREAALKLRDWFCVQDSGRPSPKVIKVEDTSLINPPLNFTLRI